MTTSFFTFSDGFARQKSILSLLVQSCGCFQVPFLSWMSARTPACGCPATPFWYSIFPTSSANVYTSYCRESARTLIVTGNVALCFVPSEISLGSKGSPRKLRGTSGNESHSLNEGFTGTWFHA